MGSVRKEPTQHALRTHMGRRHCAGVAGGGSRLRGQELQRAELVPGERLPEVVTIMAQRFCGPHGTARRRTAPHSHLARRRDLPRSLVVCTAATHLAAGARAVPQAGGHEQPAAHVRRRAQAAGHAGRPLHALPRARAPGAAAQRHGRSVRTANCVHVDGTWRGPTGGGGTRVFLHVRGGRRVRLGRLLEALGSATDARGGHVCVQAR